MKSPNFFSVCCRVHKKKSFCEILLLSERIWKSVRNGSDGSLGRSRLLFHQPVCKKFLCWAQTIRQHSSTASCDLRLTTAGAATAEHQLRKLTVQLVSTSLHTVAALNSTMHLWCHKQHQSYTITLCLCCHSPRNVHIGHNFMVMPKQLWLMEAWWCPVMVMACWGRLLLLLGTVEHEGLQKYLGGGSSHSWIYKLFPSPVKSKLPV